MESEMRDAAETYEGLQAGFVRADGMDRMSAHELIGLLDFQLRFLGLVAACCLRRHNKSSIGLTRAPGFGAHMALLKKSANDLARLDDDLTRRIHTAIEAVVGDVEHGVPSAPSGLGSPKRLRDHLFHGGPLPGGDGADSVTAAVRVLVDSVASRIVALLADAEVVPDLPDDEHPPVLRWTGGHTVSLWPLVLVEADGTWCVYSQSSPGKAVYMRPGRHDVQRVVRDEEVLGELERGFLPAARADNALADFIIDVQLDVLGFRDADIECYVSEQDDRFTLGWQRAVSDGIEARQDQFRLGPENARQWFDQQQDTFRPYSVFLRRLANWPTLAKRLRQELEGFEEQRRRREADAIGRAGVDSGPFIQPLVQLGELDALSTSGPSQLDGLIQTVDMAVESNRGQTLVVFVAGEAGIGKTRAMSEVALNRAREVEAAGDADPDSGKPLYLFVTSRGQEQDSLDRVVNAAVVNTRNLREDAVKALCRNGLMVLFIDGFDELLGGNVYRDPVGSLRKWIEALGGRGVILVSARSSYYLNRYRASIDKQVGQHSLAVAHKLAELRRWDDPRLAEFLSYYGLPEKITLGSDDRKLLGLPFFAHVYVDQLLKGKPSDAPLPEILLTQYLAREADKLDDPSAGVQDGGDLAGPLPENAPLLSTTQLRKLFEAVALLMAGNSQREVLLEDLEWAAQLALDAEQLDSRIRERLIALCGLEPGTSQQDQRFRFQHELFFDYFLAGHIGRLLEQEDQPGGQIVGDLSSAQLRPATVAEIVRTSEEALERFLRSSDASPDRVAEHQRDVLNVNLGNLWIELAQVTGRIEAVTLDGVSLENLDLSNVDCKAVRLEGCELQTLVLPAGKGWTLDLDDSQIGQLDVRKAVDFGGLVLSSAERLTQLTTSKVLVSRVPEIAQALRRLGAQVPEVASVRATGRHVEAAETFLRRIVGRAEVTVVVDTSSLLPDDQRLSWAIDYGAEVWKDFVRTLKESDVARLDGFDARGGSKRRVRFLVSPKAILQRAAPSAARKTSLSPTDEQNVASFWARLRQAARE
jgi:hypothetical protein